MCISWSEYAGDGRRLWWNKGVGFLAYLPEDQVGPYSLSAPGEALNLLNTHPHSLSLLPSFTAQAEKCKTHFSCVLCSKEGHMTVLWPVSCNLKSPRDSWEMCAFLIKGLITGPTFPFFLLGTRGSGNLLASTSVSPEDCRHTLWCHWATEPMPESFYPQTSCIRKSHQIS